MYPLIFSLEASLLAPLVEFATSTSGHVEPRRGLALGWLGSVVAGLAVVFGTVDRAQADDCHDIPEDECGIACTDVPCKFTHSGRPIRYYNNRFCHNPTNGCVEDPVENRVCYC